MTDRYYRILILATLFPVAGGRYLAHALSRLGHDVKVCGESTGRSIWGIEVNERHVWKADYESGLDLFNDDWRPDLIITTWFDQPPLHLSAVPIVVFSTDNHVRTHEGNDIAHYFLAHYGGEAQPVDPTRDDMTWLPCASDSSFNRHTLPHERPIQAAMLGNLYKHRAALLATLSPEFHIACGLGPLFEEYEAIYNRSVVSICCSIKQDAACRVFETARMGCVMLCDPVPDFERLGFEPYKHYLPFTIPAEALEQLRALFAGPPERIAELAQNAYEWSLPHTWESRGQTMIKVLQKRGVLPE